MKPRLVTVLVGCLVGIEATAQVVLPFPPQRPGEAAQAPRSPKPEAALPALLKLFEDHTVVGFSDLHGCAELLAFVEQLVRTPEFSARVNDLTWEPGNARYQKLMDSFILEGKDVPYKQLAQCWRNNTQSHTYSDTPALFRLLQTIRSVNLARPATTRLRVLLIDPPVDWSRIRSKEDYREKDFDRESHMAEVLEREVYARGRKVLFFAGGAHLSRGAGLGGLVSPLEALERKHPGTTFNVAIHEGFGDRTEQLEARLSDWPKPALAAIRGTWWGELTPAPGGDVFIGRDGKPVELKADRKIQDGWDAVLYLGKRKELTRVDPPGPDILDAQWMSEMKRRKALRGGPELKEKPFSRQFFSDEN